MALVDEILKSILHLNDRVYSVSVSSTELAWEPTTKKSSETSFSNTQSRKYSKKENRSSVTLIKVQDKNLNQVFDESTQEALKNDELKSEISRVKLNEILSVKTSDRSTTPKQHKYTSVPGSPSHPQYLNIWVVRRVQKHRWRTRKLSFYSSDRRLIQQWADRLNALIQHACQRPKRVMVFINPVGGKKKAPEIFHQKVAPYFDMTGLHYDVIMTERANHARDLIMECDLSKIDGLVSVGGDGMFTEILHGIMARTYKDHGLTGPKAGADLLRPTMKLGIIPAGSTDTVIWSLQGCSDPTTAALHIAVGDILPMDVASLHHGEEFIKYNVSLLAYGYYGDVLIDSEMHRWMGPRRYDWAGLKKFLNHRSYEGEFSYIPSPTASSHPRDGNICMIGCSVCGATTKELNLESRVDVSAPINVNDGEWKNINGRFLAINAFLISCRCRFSKDGPSPNAHLGDGCFDVVLIHDCTRANYFKHLYRCTQHGKDQFDLPNVEVIRVKAFRFTPREQLIEESRQSMNSSGSRVKNSTWNCDGEIVEEPAIDVRAHAQVVQMFARGVEDEHLHDDIGNSSSCLQAEKEN